MQGDHTLESFLTLSNKVSDEGSLPLNGDHAPEIKLVTTSNQQSLHLLHHL